MEIPELPVVDKEYAYDDIKPLSQRRFVIEEY